MSLALAALEDEVAELEALAAQDGTVFDDLLELLTAQTIVSIAFVDIVTVPGDQDTRLDAITARVAAALSDAVTPAQRRAVANDCWSLLRRTLTI